ncbi:MAG TPA: hydroxymethylglutaryl-CoA lyase [Candidatus Acidoferrales bacterium]|nr:hydroxymethylglutaryl-CoA lyase [Candidatus Acidoferrales bacterium]
MDSGKSVTVVECPRDAWQGLPQIIPTQTKIDYLSRLVSLGFRHLDAVSFVAPKYVPQMADSEEVMAGLVERFPADQALPEMIGIVVNEQGLRRALGTRGVSTIGYPYSISAYFRRANANMTRAESRALVETLQKETKAAKRNLVVYISMAFGNPYDEPWGPEIVEDALVWLKDIGVRSVSLADTVGAASPHDVAELFSAVKKCVAGVQIGVHLHSRPDGAAEKVMAAFEAGCRRFDGALTGLGGCPFAGDDLVGNIPTETVLTTLAARGVATGIDSKALALACAMTGEIRKAYGHEVGAPKPN